MPKEDLQPPDSQLQNDPVTRWELELRSVLAGQRDANIRRLGSTKGYVDSKLAESEDRSLSETAFRKALRNVVEEWQPTPHERERTLARMLELIQAYCPVRGELKILGYIKRWGRFGELSDGAKPVPTGQDLHMKALAALDEYFQISPARWRDEGGPFSEYVEVLDDDLRHEAYRGYAVGRLIDLKVLEARDGLVRKLIGSHPDCLQALMATFLRGGNRQKTEAALTDIYEHCLWIGEDLPRRFEEGVAAYGGRLDPDGSIYIRGEVILLNLLNLSDEAVRKHVLARWDRELHFSVIKDVLGGRAEEDAVSIVLTDVYEKCIQLGENIPTEFERELPEHGARLEHRNEGLPVVIHEGREIPLRLSQEAWKYYVVQVQFGAQERKIEEMETRLEKALIAGSNGGG